MGIDSSTAGVERELSDGNAHAIDTEVTETEDTGAISHDNNVDVLRGPVVEDRPEVTTVGPREVKT